LELVAIIGIVTAIAPFVIGHPEEVDYTIREKIKEVELYVGKELPKAWEYWNTYEGETKWGNKMFFSWDKQTHFAKAKGAITELQKYLQDEINKYEIEKKKGVAGMPAIPSWIWPVAIAGVPIAITGIIMAKK